MNDVDTQARREVEGFGGRRRPAPVAENKFSRMAKDEVAVIRIRGDADSHLARLSTAELVGRARTHYRNPRSLGLYDFPTRDRGPYIATYTGRFHPFDPQPQDVRIDDIAHGLSSLVRYTGHGKERYSVAEHSVHIARWLRGAGYDTDTQLAGLLHDAPEALSGFGDVARPSKSRAPIIKETEDAIYRLAIAPAFGLSPDIPDAVHEADMRICADEMAQNMREVDPNVGPPLGIRLCFWSQAVAEGTFMQVFRGLMDERAWEIQQRRAA